MILLRAYIRGLLSYVPVLDRRFSRATRGTDSPRYCYSVWLRHLTRASQEGLDTCPDSVAEIGPGDSLGTGLAALLCGANRYDALDVVDYTRLDRNLDTLEKLVQLFQRREPVPGDDEFPFVEPKLGSYPFPDGLLEERLADSLRPQRIRAIRSALIRPGQDCDGICISWRAPWYDSSVIRRSSVDAVISQAVFEHVDDVAAAHRAVFEWLRPGGWASHTIDFSAHHLAKRWNAHWTVGKFGWRVIRGRRPWLLNRQPASAQLAWMQDAGLELVQVTRIHESSEVPESSLAGDFRTLSDEDLQTRAMHVIARRPGGAA